MAQWLESQTGNPKVISYINSISAKICSKLYHKKLWFAVIQPCRQCAGKVFL